MAFLKRAILINLTVILAIIAALAVFFATPWGRPAFTTLLLVPEVVPDFPIRPLKYFSQEPKVEEINLKVGDKEIKADLYRPQDNKKHPGIIITLGILATRQNSGLIKMANALSRIGFIVLIPDIADFQSGIIWTDSVETLISSVEFLDKQDNVVKNKIGFAGFCIGSSISMVAAEDVRIADKVSYLIGVSPYFDLYSTVDAIRGRYRENQDQTLETWKPADLAFETFYKGFINYVVDEKEREALKGHFLDSKELSQDTVKEFSKDAKDIYEFLTNRDYQKESWDLVPDRGKQLLTLLSPSTKIDKLRAKLFILNDKNDSFVPRSEGEKLVKSLPKEQIYFAEVDSFEHVNPKTKLERWSALKQIFQISRFVYNILREIQS